MKMKKQNGITLIALIITIILMLILASVVLNITLGENGLFKTASGAAQKYKLEEMREKIELAIADVVSKEIVLGNEITVENVLQELLENGTFETIDKEAGIGTIDKYDITLKKNEDGSIVIESIEETTGVRVTYKLDPISYTNQEKVTIQFKAVGEVKSVTKPDGNVAYPNQGKVEINYEVDKNGTYTFIVENKEGTPITKNVIVDTIDRLPPLDFEITAGDTGTGIKINAKTEDADSDGVSVKSGMDRYEYYVKKEGDPDYTKYDTSEIMGLSNGTYKIYVKAYDKAGNDTTSNEITVKIVGPEIGDFVNYTAGNWTQADLEKMGVTFDESGNIINNGPLYAGSSIPDSSSKFKFGGFKIGQSKDKSIGVRINTNLKSGWRILSLNEDKSIKEIIHVGTPEGYYHPNATNDGYRSQYILGGGKDSSISDNVFSGLIQRDWSMYEDDMYSLKGSARLVTFNEMNSDNALLKTPLLEHIWIPFASAADSRKLYYVNGTSRSISPNISDCFGIRPVVTLKSGIKVKSANPSDTAHSTLETAWNLEL